jgi:hypothetical protein
MAKDDSDKKVKDKITEEKHGGPSDYTPDEKNPPVVNKYEQNVSKEGEFAAPATDLDKGNKKEIINTSALQKDDEAVAHPKTDKKDTEHAKIDPPAPSTSTPKNTKDAIRPEPAQEKFMVGEPLIENNKLISMLLGLMRYTGTSHIVEAIISQPDLLSGRTPGINLVRASKLPQRFSIKQLPNDGKYIVSRVDDFFCNASTVDGIMLQIYGFIWRFIDENLIYIDEPPSTDQFDVTTKDPNFLGFPIENISACGFPLFDLGQQIMTRVHALRPNVMMNGSETHMRKFVSMGLFPDLIVRATVVRLLEHPVNHLVVNYDRIKQFILYTNQYSHQSGFIRPENTQQQRTLPIEYVWEDGISKLFSYFPNEYYYRMRAIASVVLTDVPLNPYPGTAVMEAMALNHTKKSSLTFFTSMNLTADMESDISCYLISLLCLGYTRLDVTFEYDNNLPAAVNLCLALIAKLMLSYNDACAESNIDSETARQIENVIATGIRTYGVKIFATSTRSPLYMGVSNFPPGHPEHEKNHDKIRTYAGKLSSHAANRPWMSDGRRMRVGERDNETFYPGLETRPLLGPFMADFEPDFFHQIEGTLISNWDVYNDILSLLANMRNHDAHVITQIRSIIIFIAPLILRMYYTLNRYFRYNYQCGYRAKMTKLIADSNSDDTLSLFPRACISAKSLFYLATTFPSLVNLVRSVPVLDVLTSEIRLYEDICRFIFAFHFFNDWAKFFGMEGRFPPRARVNLAYQTLPEGYLRTLLLNLHENRHLNALTLDLFDIEWQSFHIDIAKEINQCFLIKPSMIGISQEFAFGRGVKLPSRDEIMRYAYHGEYLSNGIDTGSSKWDEAKQIAISEIQMLVTDRAFLSEIADMRRNEHLTRVRIPICYKTEITSTLDFDDFPISTSKEMATAVTPFNPRLDLVFSQVKLRQAFIAANPESYYRDDYINLVGFGGEVFLPSDATHVFLPHTLWPWAQYLSEVIAARDGFKVVSYLSCLKKS